MTPESIEEFQAEAELMRQLRPHANVVQLMGVCHEPLSLLTEFMESGSLDVWLKKNPNVDVGELYPICTGIARGMMHLHLEGIIHRDVSCSLGQVFPAPSCPASRTSPVLGSLAFFSLTHDFPSSLLETCCFRKAWSQKWPTLARLDKVMWFACSIMRLAHGSGCWRQIPEMTTQRSRKQVHSRYATSCL
jgi:Protein tyrosine and serine/threonine kinase